MSNTKQDLRQIQAKEQQSEQLGLPQGFLLNNFIDKIDIELDFPFKIHASFPTPNSKVNFSDSVLISSDGTVSTALPVQDNVPLNLSSLWVDFQNQTVSNGSDFDIVWPTSNTLNFYRIVGFTLINTNKISAIFSGEFAIENTLPNPGNFFVSSGLPLGYIVLQCTDSAGYFKTAGSTSNVIENNKIFRFDSRAGGGGEGAGEVNSAINIGTGIGLFKQKVGVDLEFKKVKSDANAIISSDANSVTISTINTEANTASNLGLSTGGIGLFLNKSFSNFNFKSLLAGTAVTLTNNSDTIDIAIPDGETNTASNIGSGVGLWKQKIGSNLIFKRISAGSGVSVSTSPLNDSIIISGGGEANTASNINSNTSIAFNTAPIRSILRQSDNKIVVCGSFGAAGLITSAGITRLNIDGTVDSSFNIGGAGATTTVFDAVQRSDGKLVVIGPTSYNGLSTNQIIRLNPDGSLDASFNVGGSGFASLPTKIIKTYENKLLVCGGFNSYNGFSPGRLVRINEDGSRDSSLNIGTGFNGSVDAIAETSNSIIAGGSFTSYNGTTRNRIVRLNIDGSADTSFNIGTGFNSGSIFSIAVQQDGKMIIGGSFTSYNGTTRNRIVRLNIDGSADTSFNIGTGFNGDVKAISIQPDGNIIVGGSFTTYKGTTANRIIRLNSIGDIDIAFNTGAGFSNSVECIEQQPDGKVLIGGSFGAAGDVTALLTRLNAYGLNYSSLSFNQYGTVDTSFRTGGVGFFKQKTGVNLEFKTAISASGTPRYIAGSQVVSGANSISIQKYNKYEPILGDIVESPLSEAEFIASRPDGSTWVEMDGGNITGSDLCNTYPYISTTLPNTPGKYIKINL